MFTIIPYKTEFADGIIFLANVCRDNRTKSSCLYLCEKYKLNTVELGYVEVNGPHFCIRNNQKQAINQRTENTMAKRIKCKQQSTKHYTENQILSNIKNLGWTLVFWKCKQFLLHSWHVSCYCCKPGDKSWMRNGQECEYDKHHRALQFIPAPTSPWLIRKHFLLANKSMLLASQL